MEANQDYKAGLTGGTLLSIIPHLSGTRIVETMVLAAVGAIVSFFVSRLLRKLFGRT